MYLGWLLLQYPVISCKSFLFLLSPLQPPIKTTLCLSKAVVLESSWKNHHLPGSLLKIYPQRSDQWIWNEVWERALFAKLAGESDVLAVFVHRLIRTLDLAQTPPLVTCSSTAFHTFQPSEILGFGLVCYPKWLLKAWSEFYLKPNKFLLSSITHLNKHPPKKKFLCSGLAETDCIFLKVSSLTPPCPPPCTPMVWVL